MTLSKIALTGLLSLFLTACALPSPTVIDRPVKVQPPEELLAECPVPGVPNPLLNGQLAELLLATRSSLESCNLDKKALREWSNG